MTSLNKAGKRQVSQDEIEKRAYEIYLERGGSDGMDLEDWLVAERELIGEPEQSDVPEGPNVPLYSHRSSFDTSMSADPEDAGKFKPRGRSAAAGDRSSS
jgi:Protein of unknown function (DUF2934)